MKILLYTWFGSYTDDDTEKNLIKMGHVCKRIRNESLQFSDRYENDDFYESFAGFLDREKYDCVFTTNFHPLIAKVCYEKEIPYIAWSYDSPPNIPDTRYMDFPTNRIFFFSRDDVEDFRSQGIDTVYYMPLAVDTGKWDAVKVTEKVGQIYKADISLVGSLYSSTLPGLMNMMSEEQRIFFERLSEIQLKSYDKYLLKDFITDGVAGEVCQSIAEKYPDSVRPTSKQLIYATASYVTHLDRMLLLRVLSRKYGTHLYTQKISTSEKEMLKDVIIHGPVTYDKEMPLVFKNTKINLCPTFRGNVSGIPLRILDVMGCGAFVLTPYREEIEEYFTNGREIVTYHSPEEALDKADFYIKNDKERRSVAMAGYERVKKGFSYCEQLAKMLRTI
ncbi:MAG: glycosyltransferase [Lachnospiraceae bacterium]|nr:glycosyltransferase [Lachnospiraceae bacterium]